MTKKYFYIVILFLVSISFFSCNPARRLPEGKYLLNRNRIEVQDAEVERSELASYLRQKPNRRILGFYRFHLNVYQLADRGRETGFRNWMKNTIGEPPVIYDPILTQNTTRQFELYLNSKGYFNAEVSFEENLKRQRALITYSIKGNKPYTVRNLSYNVRDPYIREFILADTLNTLIQPGERYDADVLQRERNRLTRHLRNEGFHQFNREFIYFQVDSSLNSHQVNIELLVNNPVRQVPGIRDSVVELRHRRYMIDRLMILPEYSPLLADQPREDTTIYVRRLAAHDKNYDYIFLHNGPLRIKPSIVSDHIILRPGEFFRLSDVEQSYSFLSGMRNYRYINLHFSESPNPVMGEPSDTLGFLDARVQLNRSAANAFTIEAEGLNTAGNLGVAGNLLYQNRNIFRGAEIFNLRFKGALEVTGDGSTGEVFQRFPFNTLELGVEAGIDFPKLLLPFSIERLSRNSRPKSTILTGVNFRQRPDYTRYVLNLSYGFEWNETPQKRHFIYPLEISSIRVYNDSILRANIPDANPFILSRFRDHLILGLKHTYIYNTQELGKIGDFMYLRTNFESAGNILDAVAGAFNFTMDEEGSFNVFNIPYSQYIKGDADFRFYRVFDDNQTLVFRIMSGLGLPYGNSVVMPFIKSYYGGGANSLRAWRIYSLGPGSYSSPNEGRFDRYGDVKLETNLEYRFRFYQFWHGAFFADAGNVWFVRKNDQFPGGEFKFNSFINDIALGGGLGLRLDFNFFVLRVDAAVPLRDPSLAKGSRWISSWPGFSEYNFNLGIGYPF
ncbi:MAG: BamA/TamA family outer membrane protein [Bacteroidales bacterium]|nr:BamA/TamA family outer membrane protein [Bacteroidales bacterium]